MPSVTVTTTQEIKLTPALKKKLMKDLRMYAELHTQEKAIQAAKKKCSVNVETILTDLGETSLAVEGFKSTIVAPVRRKLDEKKFVALGGDLDMLRAAEVETPGKAYLKITPPGAKGEDD